ncbi:HDOD domain-containing protein [Oceanidesulfovibrio marinus]|uniref:HDOD domain-containing protein n=2 Tax=Oceanidesulfovibrio marinus TaxID=370038 RepID=A0A6P1ZFE5_9BACT|nr:HDOD domain-containing protein [Oceanidesulfovibrio marinus]
MGMIFIDDLTPGMKLADDLRGPNGRMLLPKHTVLDESHLRIITIWGVTEANIEGYDQSTCAAASIEALDPTILAKSDRFAQRLFRFCDKNDPVVQELCRLATLRTAADLTAGKHVPDVDEVQDLPALPDSELLSPPLPESVAQVVSQEVQLATFPDIYFQVMRVLENPNSSSAQVANVVSKDPSLTTRLMQLVNSPFYGLHSKIDSIARATTIVGSQELSILTLGITVLQYFEDIPPDFFNMKRFWTHSIASGIYAKLIASRLPGFFEERYFMLGLIHDIGRLVIFKTFPHAALEVFRLAMGAPCLIHKAERTILGFDHTEVAEAMLEAWDFPDSLRGVIGCHHDPVSDDKELDCAVLHVADVLARALRSGYRGKFSVSTLSAEAWERLGLSISDIAPLASQADHMIDDIVFSFLPGGNF